MSEFRVALINPSLMDKDFNYTSVVTIPLGLGYLASYLRSKGVVVEFIDGLGEDIHNVRKSGDYYLQGLSITEIIRRIPFDVDLIGINASFTRLRSRYSVLFDAIRRVFPDVPLVIGGSEATIDYEHYLGNGIDFVILGEGEHSLHELCLVLKNEMDIEDVDGIAYKKGGVVVVQEKTRFIQDLDSLPFPARDLINLEAYWSLKSAHSPVNNKSTPIMSSRGCPFDCTFCSSSVFWKRSWRARSAKNVVDEIEHCYYEYGIRDFEFEDDNLTLDKGRAESICLEIIQRKLSINWTTPDGIRPEKVDYELLKLMQRSGCKHIVLSPESASERVRKEIYHKDIDVEHIKKIVGWSYELGIKTAVFFVVGVPTTSRVEDLLNKEYIIEIAKLGADEIGVFPCMPYPATKIREIYYKGIDIGTDDLIPGIMPEWYPDRKYLAKYIRNLYITFLVTKIFYHPFKSLAVFKNLVLGRQELKIERALNGFFKNIVKRWKK